MKSAPECRGIRQYSNSKLHFHSHNNTARLLQLPEDLPEQVDILLLLRRLMAATMLRCMVLATAMAATRIPLVTTRLLRQRRRRADAPTCQIDAVQSVSAASVKAIPQPPALERIDIS
jgi:hypothetical protein